MTVNLMTLLAATDELLQPEQYSDYCPNGLQVEGSATVNKLVVGVTACQALIDRAIAEQADAILVHHGYFWKGEDACIRGVKRRRIAALLENNISLIAYHLPLDGHAVLGNNAQLAARLEIETTGSMVGGGCEVGNVGCLATPLSLADFSERVSVRLGREPLSIAGGDHDIATIAWCTGAAQDYIERAAELGVDAFLSGEISERTVHAARELGIHYIAAGHHATERFGVQALGEYLAERFDLQYCFVDIDNPV